MARWKMGVSWQVSGWIYVEADTLEEAIAKAETDETPLKDVMDADYVDASWEVDEQMAEAYNQHLLDKEVK